ncbi:GDP-mannose pyrophosphatase [Jannaschia sp. 2305UL9-9]|uniref:GDP-mannose pyrophosphatase n=1 Tax=Jannaschia sp. 2305UL9-9 TaxID=3121638 RepID=UPI003528DEB3
MTDRVRLVSSDVLAEDYGVLTRHRFSLRRSDGSWQEQLREVYDRGNGTACLLFDADAGTLLLIRQFRLPLHLATGDGMSIEVPAGDLDGARAQERVHAELLEETGYAATDLEHVMDLFAAPGSAMAMNTCYIGKYTRSDPVARGGGLKSEGEDIEVLHVPLSEALAMIRDGRIRDGKTTILIQHLALKSAGLV